MKKFTRKVEKIITKPFKKPHKKQSNPPPQPPPHSPSPPPPPPPPIRPPTDPFLFPQTQSTVLPDPTPFFSPHLLSTPLPTNSFFQNFVLKNGDQPEYIHPYLIKSSLSSLTLCYPSQFHNTAFIYQPFIPDLTISTLNNLNTNTNHIVSSFDDLSVTLDLPSSNLRFFLVRGSPYLTCNVCNHVSLSITTIHAILECCPNSSQTKYTIKLNNNQTWILYASSPINLTHEASKISSSVFFGIIRIAILLNSLDSPDSNLKYESILDRFSHCYPISGEAIFTKPFCLEYKWKKQGWGDLLMLAHPLHCKLLSKTDCSVTFLEGFKYTSIDGDLIGVVGDSWVLKTDPISMTWHSIRGVKKESYPEIIDSLVKDVDSLDATAISTTSSYFYGKLLARAARLVLIAEEVCYLEVIPRINEFLKDTIEPWLNGTFVDNGFLYDAKWGGIVTKQGALNIEADFGFGIYNGHHIHLGYFLYAISVLAKIDPFWGRKYRAQAYSIMADYINLSKHEEATYTRLRCFDLWKLHSWAGGLMEFVDGRNQESSSEAINSYYSGALMGLAYGDSSLVAIGSSLCAMEIHAAQTWWHVREVLPNNEATLYHEDFSKENKVVGVMWANKRDSGLWFASGDRRECRVGIQILPLLPISEVLFSDVRFVKELVEWVMPVIEREGGVEEGWKVFVYALEAVYDEKNGVLEKIRSLKEFNDGNSLTNLLWWIHSRVVEDEEYSEKNAWKFCMSRHYSH